LFAQRRSSATSQLDCHSERSEESAFRKASSTTKKGASAQKTKRPFYLSSARTLFSLNRPRPTLDYPRFEFRPINATLFKLSASSCSHGQV